MEQFIRKRVRSIFFGINLLITYQSHNCGFSLDVRTLDLNNEEERISKHYKNKRLPLVETLTAGTPYFQ